MLKSTLAILFFIFISTISYSQDQPLEIYLPDLGNEHEKGIYLKRNLGYLRLINGTMFDGQFQPRVSGKAQSSISPGLVLVGTVSNDNNNARGVLLRAGEYADQLNGNILEVSNYITPRMVVDVNGNLGLNLVDPKSRIHIQDGDVYVDDITSGVILKSPDGNCWRYQPDNSGNLVGTQITCP